MTDRYSMPVAGEMIPGKAATGDGIFLTSAARTRFERLQDRIQQIALSELQECIDIKDSLASMVRPLSSIALISDMHG